MRFLSASVILDGLSVQCITFCFNAYLITKPILFSTTFGKRISGLEEDFAFNFPDGSDGKESACNTRAPGLISLAQEDPLEKGMATHSGILGWRIP